MTGCQLCFAIALFLSKVRGSILNLRVVYDSVSTGVVVWSDEVIEMSGEIDACTAVSHVQYS